MAPKKLNFFEISGTFESLISVPLYRNLHRGERPNIQIFRNDNHPFHLRYPLVQLLI